MNEKVRRLTLQQNVKGTWRERHWNGKQAVEMGEKQEHGEGEQDITD